MSDKTKQLAQILALAAVGWLMFTILAVAAREHAFGLHAEDFDKAKVWATDILGLGAALAGFLGIARSAQNEELATAERARTAQGGMVGLLAGVTLLNIGGWPVPLALVVLATGLVVDQVARTARDS